MARGPTPPKTTVPETGETAPSPLKALRDELDVIDTDIVRLIARRLETVAQIIKAKSSRTAGIRDPAREREVLNRVEAAARQVGLSGPLVRRIFADIIAYSVSMQATTLSGTGGGGKEMLVALQGGPQSYDHLAAQQYLAGRGMRGGFLTCESMRDAVDKLLSREADLVFLPIENTFAGSINQVYDLLREQELHIVGEETFKVDHCLAALADVPLTAIEKVYSHPQVLEQCSVFLDGLPGARAVATRDTAEALRTVAEGQDPAQAVIAAPEGAAAFGLHVLRHAIGNQEVIQSRFVALARDPLPVDARVPCKTSLILSTRHEHGALLRCLQILSDHGVSLTKLESRPRRNRPWEYMFFIDFEGHVEMPHVAAALAALRAQALFLKILGCYPAKATPADAVATALPAVTEPSPAVEPALRAGGPRPRLSGRQARKEDTVIRVHDLLIGGPGFAVFAGPAFVEDRAQIDAIARLLRDHGAHVLHGGVFAPPGGSDGFEGLGEAGLELLAQAGKAHGLPVSTEVMAPDQVRAAADKADILHVGARNMQNFALLREVGRIDRPVVLRRGQSSTIEEWLAAAEYIVSHGNGQVILCERGIRTFESSTRSTLDLSAVVVLRERTHLPIIVDPSRGTGNRAYVAPMAMAARACGAHGVMIEVHPDPERSVRDGEQSLDFEGFGHVMTDVSRVRG